MLRISNMYVSQGTLSDLNHLFLAAYYLQNGPTVPSAFFPRIDCATAAGRGGGTRVIGNGAPYSQASQFPYFESNIVGSINFPSGVSHVLAPFLSYWGTDIGHSLQVPATAYPRVIAAYPGGMLIAMLLSLPSRPGFRLLPQML